MAEACCTCAELLSNIKPIYDSQTEKPKAQDRRLECCSRVICGTCVLNNSRFGTYCPFCQVSTTPTPLPQGLRDTPACEPPPLLRPPPAYNDNDNDDDLLPTYTSLPAPRAPAPSEKSSSSQPPAADDVLHFLDHAHDTIPSLSLRYNVPIPALRRVNGLTSDHLLLARRTILIPGEYYRGGVSLSPRPVEGEEEEARKNKIRRWMVRCKVSEYDIALLYLQQADYDLEAAIETYKDDERWEKEHPLEASTMGKGKTRHDFGRRRFTGQRS